MMECQSLERRRIHNPLKHLKQSFMQQLKQSTTFTKGPILEACLVFEYAPVKGQYCRLLFHQKVINHD